MAAKENATANVEGEPAADRLKKEGEAPAPPPAPPAPPPPPPPPPAPPAPPPSVRTVGGTLCAQSSWAMDALLDEAAKCCGVPREHLSIAKPPTVGSKNLTSKLVAALRWDEPKLLACQKVGSHPLQLRDGDLILLRDGGAAHEGKPPPSSNPTGAPAKGGGKFARGGGKFPTVSVAGGAAPREAGLRITTCYDVPLNAPPGAGGAPPSTGAAG